MARQNVLAENVKPQITVNKRYKHSISYYLAIYLIVYMILYFYSKVLLTDVSVESYLAILGNGILFCLSFYYLFVANKSGDRKFKYLFFLFLFSVLLSFFMNFSGLEKLIGLCDILMGMMIFQRSPIKKSERKSLFYLFILVVFIILLNAHIEIGSTNIRYGAGNDNQSKFNTNVCAFLIAMLFCVSVVRFTKTKTLLSLLTVILSFALQFIFVSRTAMLACLVFVFLFVLFRTYKKTYKLRTVFLVTLIVAGLGILFAYIYAEVLFPLWGYGKVVIFGKDLFTGRQEIWHYTFTSIQENLLWGVGSHLNNDLLQSGFYEMIANAHNQPLGMLAAFGLLPFCLFYITFSYAAASSYNSKKRKFYYSNTPALFMVLITLTSWFDLQLFSEHHWLPILIAYCLICGYSKKERKIKALQ